MGTSTGKREIPDNQLLDFQLAFIKARHGRRVMITTKDKEVIHAEGLTPKELEKILEKAAWVAAIDPKKSNKAFAADGKKPRG